MVGLNAAYDVTRTVTVSDGELNILFTTVTDNAKVSAIRIEQVGRRTLRGTSRGDELVFFRDGH